MKQPKITGFFTSKISIDNLVTKSKDKNESGQFSNAELLNTLFNGLCGKSAWALATFRQVVASPDPVLTPYGSPCLSFF